MTDNQGVVVRGTGMALARKSHVPEEFRTPGKDDCADKIDALTEEMDVSELSKAEIAERVGWSRSHVQTVLKQYFEPVGDSGNGENHGDMVELSIHVPDDVDRESYLRGWLDGYIRR